MCLELRYPEHQFTIIEPFDRETESGIYADESGREFEVHNLLYNNSKHFGCYDEYLSTILREQDFEKKALQIGVQYGQRIEVDSSIISIDFWIEDILEGRLSLKEAAEIILEILNCVDTPKVTRLEEEGFSTNEINYYTKPVWGGVVFGFENRGDTLGVGYHIRFCEKDESVEKIEIKLSNIFNQIYEHEEYADLKESGDTEYIAPEYENGGSVSTNYGDYVLPKGWCINEENSTESFNVHTKEDVIFQEETSYFIIESETNLYTREEHELFKQSILSQLLQDDNLPEDANIEVISSTTENGNIVYSFRIGISSKERMTLNYVVGDRRHCLIKEVVYQGGGYTFDAAQYVINSFVWKE